MPKEKPELSDAMREKLRRKTPIKNPIKEQNLLLQFPAQKEELENLHLQLIWP